MKKFTLFAACAAVALGANAQYQVDPGAEQVLKKEGKFVVDAVLLDGTTIETFKNAGHKVNDYRVDDATRFLYIWANGETFTAGDSSYPGVDFQMDGYISLIVAAPQGWSGAGLFVSDAAGWDMSGYTEETRIHIGFRANNAPASVAFTLLDDDNFKNKAAKFSVGSAAFNDNGTVFPLVGAFDAGNDWTGIDISFRDLKRIWPDFEWSGTKAFKGNVLSFLGGGVPGKDISLDAVYFYTPAGAEGIEGVEADVNAPVKFYNLQGIEVANPENGIFIRRQGDKASKVRF